MVHPRLRSTLAIASALRLATFSAACTTREAAFDEARARAHIDMLAGAIGSRPVGSQANVRARGYLVDELRRYGFAVRLQEADGVDARQGVTARIVNIIASRDGASSDAIALVAHYDSVPEAPGAVDNGLGVAVCLESARVLAQASLRHSLFVLLTDAEENGLMGARALVKDGEVSRRMRAFLNFDGPAGAGTPLLFEAGPGWGAPLDAWARSSTPTGASFAVEIYKRLPNDTDFSVLKAGASGLNFSPLFDAYVYHTDRDVSRHVEPFSLHREIQNTVDIVRTLDATDLAPDDDAPTFFDVARRYALVYGSTATRVIAWSTCIGAIVVWLLLTRDLYGLRGWTFLVLTPFWSVVAAMAAIGAPIAVVWILRRMRTELNPWYAAPQSFYASLLAAGAAAIWLVARLAAAAPERVRPHRAPAATWWITLPVWVSLAILLQKAAPAASFLVTLPLGVASASLLIARRSMTLSRVFSLVVVGVAATVWMDRTVTILALLVPLSGWLGLTMPVWAFPAVIATACVMVAPPLAAALAGWRPPLLASRLTGAVLVSVLAVAAAVAFVSPAYTYDRPQRRAIRYVQDDIGHQAWWEVSGTERTLEVEAVPGADWQQVVDGPPSAIRLRPIGQLFQFRTATRPLVVPPPAEVRSTVSMSPDKRSVVEISIVPRENLIARIVLPNGVVPVESSLAGQVAGGQWSATYVAPAASGLNARLTLDDPSAEALRGLAVVLTVAHLPGRSSAVDLPSWVFRERSAWQARSIYIVSAAPQ